VLRVPGKAVRGKPVCPLSKIVKFYTIYTPGESPGNLAYNGFDLRKSVQKIKSYDQKTKKDAHVFKNPNFSAKTLQIGQI
jgi:hypothetical protein